MVSHDGTTALSACCLVWMYISYCIDEYIEGNQRLNKSAEEDSRRHPA